MTVGPDWLKRRIRTVVWLLWADAAIIAAAATLSVIFASGAYRWLLLAPGAPGSAADVELSQDQGDIPLRLRAECHPALYRHADRRAAAQNSVARA